MSNHTAKYIKIAVVIIIAIILGLYLYNNIFSLRNNAVKVPISSQALPQVNDEEVIIKDLLSTWDRTSAKFSSKAGESGKFNSPSKIQFISEDTMLVNYDDGLVDHVSVLQFKDNAFFELKNVGVMSTLSQLEWNTLLNTYGNANFAVSSYKSDNYRIYSKVTGNIFVK